MHSLNSIKLPNEHVICEKASRLSRLCIQYTNTASLLPVSMTNSMENHGGP